MSAAHILAFALVGTTLLSGYELDLVVSTTSDWTEIEFVDMPVAVLEQRILRATDGLKVESYHLTQPRPESIGASVFYRLLLPAPVPDEIEIAITKGDIGSTTASFRTGRSGRPAVVFENTGADPYDASNRQVRKVQKNALLGGSSVGTYDLRRPGVPKLVLAFYYAWYGNPYGPRGKWVHWDPLRGYASAHRPALGYYDSHETETIERHVSWAKGSGIDAFILSWWQIKDSEDEALRKLMDVCAEESISVCVLMEKGHRLAESLRYLAKTCFSSPVYLRMDQRPVVFYYERVLRELSADSMVNVFNTLEHEGIDLVNIGDGYGVDILDRFDGYYAYNPVFERDFVNLFYSASLTAHLKGKLFAATVVPGFDQSVTKEDGQLVPRDEGRQFARIWEGALTAEPDWILVTSFNEWHEGTEIEPSEEFGSMYLEMTREYSGRFKD